MCKLSGRVVERTTGKQNGTRKPMRSWTFLNDLPFSFSVFLLRDANLSFLSSPFSLGIKFCFQKLVIFYGLIE